MALPKDTYRKLRAQIGQYESTTGRKVSPQTLQAMLEAELRVSSDRSTQAAELELRTKSTNQTLDIQRQQVENEKRAATIGGITGTVGSGAQLYMMNKYINKMPSTGTPTTETPGVVDTAKGAYDRVSSYLTGKPTAGVGIGVGGTIASGGYAAGEGAALSSSVLSSGGYAAGEGAATAGMVTTAAPTITGAVSTVAPYVPVAGWSALAGKVGGGIAERSQFIQNITPWGGKATERAMGGVLSGAAVGTAIMPGIGTAIGAVAGWLGSMSIICGELERQEYLSHDIVVLDAIYRKKYLDDKTYEGYLKWAKYVVWLMQKSKIATFVMAPIWKSWAYEMAHQVKPTVKGSYFGKFMVKITIAFSKLLGGK